MSSSKPYNLVEAFEVLKQGRQNQHTSSVDILGIVSNVSCSEDAQRCQIWLLDESFPGHSVSPQALSTSSNNASAHIVLYGLSDVTRVKEEEIRSGDILRLNRVVLKASTNIQNNRDDVTGKSNTWEGSLQFQFCLHDTEPGLSWYCLGCIDGHGKFIEKYYDGAMVETRIPENMMTSDESIKCLVNWYNNHPNHRPPRECPSKFESSTIQMETNSHLNTLPCRKRKLEEIQSSVGLISNITVRVKKFYSQPATVVDTSYIFGKKKKQKILPPVVFAVVTDDSGVIMTLIDTSGRYLYKLRSAKNDNNKMLLVLTNILTVYQNNFQVLKHSSKEIVLVPTKTTSGVLMSEHDYSNKDNINISSFNTGQQIREIMPIAEKTFISCVVDLCIGGISLKNSCINSDQSIFSTTTNYLKIILDHDRQYKSARIYFEENGVGQAIAGPAVLKSLCGSLDVAELLDDNTLCNYSMRFLRALIMEYVVLKWTIYIDDDNEMKVSNAVLHQYPE